MLTALMDRWRRDLRELTAGILSDPLAQKIGRRWDRDFGGEIGPKDTRYAIFLGVVSVMPAAAATALTHDIQWRTLARLFGAPLQVVITGFLTASLVFLGSHVNRCPRPFSVAFKLMLRIMAIYPLWSLVALSGPGAVAALLLHGLFVVRGVVRTYSIPLTNALLFFGVIYVVFAMMTAQSLLAGS